MPENLIKIVSPFVNFGLGVHRFLAENGLANNLVVGLIIGIPIFLAQILKWIVLYPTYMLVGLILGEKRMGTVTHSVNYYAGAADWYIEELLSKNPNELSREELFDLSFLTGELKNA